MKPPTVVDRALRWLFFWLVVRPIVLVGLGLNVRHRERLPAGGPAVLVANHNSHLDTMVLMTLLPSRLLPLVHPVAAADYFLRNPFLAWFALRIIGIIPIQRRPAAPASTGGPDSLAAPDSPVAPAAPTATIASTVTIAPAQAPSGSQRPDALADVAAALERGAIVILFPEGSRGEPERLSEFKTGVARLCERFPRVPFIPLFLHGLGKALPRGSIVPVPFFCDIFVGEAVPWCDDHHLYVDRLRSSLESLSTEDHLAAWE